MISSPLPDRSDVLVVGAGLSGLSCARLLLESGRDVHVVDAADAVGGRIRTDEMDGFRLDRGFQVILTAYEELSRQVDLSALSLGEFDPGSMIWTGRDLEILGDPFRKLSAALPSLMASVGGWGDKVRVAKLRQRLLGSPAEAAFSGEERTTLQELRALGFSEPFIDGFFRPFLGGVFLERDLETSASLFRFYFRCFAEGAAAIPAQGMQRLPEQLAQPLRGRITLDAHVAHVTTDGVRLADGTSIIADEVVVAVDGMSQADLLGAPPVEFKSTVTTYFATDIAPDVRPMLILDGEGTGPANHVAVVSNVASELAPDGMHLISVSGVDAAADDPDTFAATAQRQLTRWFGPSVERWDHLRTYRVAHALPKHPPGSLTQRDASPRRKDGLVLAGDHLQFGALQGALLSGRRAAEAVLDAVD